MSEKQKRWESLKSIGFALLLALSIRCFLIEPFKIPSPSMVPGLLVGDQIFANKFVYGLRIPFTKIRFWNGRDPQRGEVIIFLYPEDESKNYIKRVVGVPGDTIQVKMDRVFVNGEELPKEALQFFPESDGGELIPVVPPKPHSKMTFFKEWKSFQFFLEKNGEHEYWVQYDRGSDFSPEVKVPPGHYFVMGDNRDNSADSRFWGFVPRENIKGRGMFIWLSVDWPEAPYGASFFESFGFQLTHWPSVRWHRFGRWIY